MSHLLDFRLPSVFGDYLLGKALKFISRKKTFHSVTCQVDTVCESCASMNECRSSVPIVEISSAILFFFFFQTFTDRYTVVEIIELSSMLGTKTVL
jgi:hypothetical protein